MPKIEILNFVLSKGMMGILLIVFLFSLKILYTWLLRAKPIEILLSIFNWKSQQMEKMLAQDYLSVITSKRVILELTQINHIKLSGLIDPRLADAAINITTRFRLRSNYLKRWRLWLSENEGVIEFNKKSYRKSWIAFLWLIMPLSTVSFGFVVYIITGILGVHLLPLIMVLNAFWWFPFLIAMSTPPPELTKKMEDYLKKYNEKKADPF